MTKNLKQSSSKESFSPSDQMVNDIEHGDHDNKPYNNRNISQLKEQAIFPSSLHHEGGKSQQQNRQRQPQIETSFHDESFEEVGSKRGRSPPPPPINTSFPFEESNNDKTPLTPSKTRDIKSPSTPSTEPSTPPNVVVEHRSKNKKRSAALSLFTTVLTNKPMVGLILAYIIFMTGAGGFLLKSFFSIPGLNSQIAELKVQVDRLNGEVDRLEVEVDELTRQVDRLSGEVDRLDDANGVLEVNVEKLTNANIVFKGLNAQLNASNIEYARLNEEFSIKIQEYHQNNQQLNETVQDLTSEVSTLESINENLTISVSHYKVVTVQLTTQVGTLTNLTNDLNTTVDLLGDEVAHLKTENDRYTRLNQDLGKLVKWLDSAAEGVQRTYESLASYLSEKITVDREILNHAVRERYEKDVRWWNCALRTRFRFRQFTQDETSLIGEDNVEDIMGFVEENLLTEICADSRDFETFLISEKVQGEAGIGSLTLLEFESAVTEYSVNLIDYYFPDEGETGGLTAEDWEDADYTCQNLPKSKAYSFSS